MKVQNPTILTNTQSAGWSSLVLLLSKELRIVPVCFRGIVLEDNHMYIRRQAAVRRRRVQGVKFLAVILCTML